MRIAVSVLLLIAAPAAAQSVYFGNLHAHTGYSDGMGTPDDAYRMAREAGLDFLAVTEHNHDAADGSGDRRDGVVIATNPTLYAGGLRSLERTARSHTNASFVALYGQEFSTISSGNHVNIFEIAEVIDEAQVPNGAFDRLLTWLGPRRDSQGLPALIQFNHPRTGSRSRADYGRTDFVDEAAWVAALDRQVELIEVLNAPALKDGVGFRAHSREADYFRYFNLGFHLGPSVGHDNHYRNWGRSTDARIGVVAAELTRAALLDAMRRRHVFATEDKNLRIWFLSGAALAGDIVPAPAAGTELALSIALIDGDEPNARYRIDIFQDQPGDQPAATPVESFEIRGNTPTAVVLDGVRLIGEGAFVLARVTQFAEGEHAEDDRSWTAPIWFESGAPAPANSATLVIAALLPDPLGDELTGEQVTLRNTGAVTVSFSGWRLRDLAQNSWSLDAEAPLAPGAERVIGRNRQAMSLNNGGDEIELVAPDGTVVQTVSYGRTAAGDRVVPQP